eukprot:CAMPEP_0183712840 /NCGR_PEP_ID=MMETSP0737-20130205/7896_1 /TAXON_ID=385413 /ORGANISM="Thalassiosira miniscula, Strain CCMP1093" /LENGTH=752 /DNA_ID=CAMNT_0025941553 /DNA_START=130 /DNA_END=2385 /DNA_ORIENTATION=+
MTPQELSICREIHAGLTSPERNNLNYIFLEPVDASYFPTYLSIVKRPMDLRTLKENLEKGTYATKEDFYVDAKLIFDNAVLFNKDREDSNWVVVLAKQMSKAFQRVRKNAEKKAEKKAARLAAASSGDGSSAGNESKPSSSSKEGEKKKSSSSSSSGDQKASKEGGKKKKINIKLKRQKSSASVGDASKASSGDSSAPTADAAASATSNDSKPSKKSKTKLKLKLSTASGSDTKKGDDTPKASAKSSKTPKSSSSSSSTSSKQQQQQQQQQKQSDPKDEVAPQQLPMNPSRKAQCYKIISSLKRRQSSACKWFNKPVSDLAIIKDYKEKIKNPTDLSTILSKLDKNQYAYIGDFVLDLRRIAANCLQYNTTIDDSFRPLAIDFLTTAEDLCKFFIAKVEAPKVAYPPLLYCWPECIKAIDELVNMTNPDDNLQTAWFFLHPVSYFCGGAYPDGYLDKVKNPIDLGTIVQHLVSGRYRSAGAFVADCRSVVQNCNAYYAGDDEGAALCEKANRLYGSMEKNLGELFLFDQSDKGTKAREKVASKYMTIKKPEKDFLRDIMRELRAATYTDKSAKITEKATLHFEKPVDTAVFADYIEFVETPMDLETVDRKIESGSYMTPEDFEYDVALIFKNCEYYNAPKKNFHMVNLGKHTAKIFRKLFAEKMRGGSVIKRPSLPTSANRVPSASMGGKGAGKVSTMGKVGGKKRPASPVPEERPSKRVSIKGPSRTASKSVSSSSSGKAAPKSKVGKKFA